MEAKLKKIPKLLSSKVSIFIYIFLFFYLFVLPVVAFLIPSLEGVKPSDTTQLILGNYTNVLSALGASLAAGSGVAVQTKVVQMQKNYDHLKQSHQELKKSLDNSHDKIDAMHHRNLKD